MFQSTRPLRGATDIVNARKISFMVSIHAPLAGRDTNPHIVTSIATVSIHAPLAGRDAFRLLSAAARAVSIHAPLAGRDRGRGQNTLRQVVSIHAPLAGRDRAPDRRERQRRLFQSTRPLRGATRSMTILFGCARSFNPRAPCGARHQEYQVCVV